MEYISLPEFSEPRVQWTRINGSTTIKSVGYSDGNLYVAFKPRGMYVYYHVPVMIYRRFLKAPSKGKFLWARIRDVYDFDKLVV